MIPANVRSALLLAIGVLLLGGVAAVLLHDDGASTTQTASTSSTTIGSPGTTGATGDSSTSSSPPTTAALGGGGSSPTSTTLAPGSFLGAGPGTEMQRATEDDVLAYTGWGPPLAAVLLLLALAAGTRATAVAARPR